MITTLLSPAVGSRLQR